MATSDWTVLRANNVSHSLIDTLGLDMDQNYCWNVRTTTNPGTFIAQNTLVGEHVDTKPSPGPFSNMKVRCLIRKNAAEAIPFLFLRGGTAYNSDGYKLALRQDGKFALYKEHLDIAFSSTPLLISAETFAINTTHHIEFSIYSQPNGDTFIEAYKGDRANVSDPYATEGWMPIFKTMVFYNEPPIFRGYCGFGHYGVLANAYSYFDLFEVYEELVQ